MNNEQMNEQNGGTVATKTVALTGEKLEQLLMEAAKKGIEYGASGEPWFPGLVENNIAFGVMAEGLGLSDDGVRELLGVTA